MTRHSPDTNALRRRVARRRSFTLVELMISVAMIALLSSMVLLALFGVTEHAKESRTRSQIARLHGIIMEKWDSYYTRSIPISIPYGTTNNAAAIAWMKLVAVRELMRMELPERITDLNDVPTPIRIERPTGGFYTAPLLPAPATWRGFRRVAGYATNATTAPVTWSETHQFSECLYLIVAASRDGERSAIEYFLESEIGDVDNDGMREILDGWGRPIYFLRWAPGFTYHPGFNHQLGVAGKWGNDNVDDNGDGDDDDIFERGWLGSDDVLVSDVQSVNAQDAPDPFDPLRVDRRWRDVNPYNDPFALVPLIVSAGRDGVYDIFDAPAGFRYAALPANTNANTFTTLTQVFNNDPYITFSDPAASNMIPVYQIGMPFDGSGSEGGGPDGLLGSDDNITNHLITSR